jgi:hypothetical protein
MNFSVPSDVKKAFDKTFVGQNKSAVLTDLMRQAVEDRNRRRRRARAIAKLLQLRRQTRPISDRAMRRARTRARP